MKKILSLMAFATLAMTLVFVACEKDDKPETEVAEKKLPSKITLYRYQGDTLLEESVETPFAYDEQNRFTGVDVSYNQNGTLASWGGHTFEYAEDQIIVKQAGDNFATILLNDGEQMIKQCFEDCFEYTYNSDGNTEEQIGNTFVLNRITYTNIPAIFRNANMPQWFFQFFFDYWYQNKGYMVDQVESLPDEDESAIFSTYTYEEVDENNYVIKMKEDLGANYYNIYVIEYIPAK